MLTHASAQGWASALVDLEGVLSLSSLVVRIERAYDRELKGTVRRTVDALFRAWQVGLSLGAGGFTATLRSNPRIDVESVLLRPEAPAVGVEGDRLPHGPIVGPPASAPDYES